MPPPPLPLVQGTLDLLVLRTLVAGPCTATASRPRCASGRTATWPSRTPRSIRRSTGSIGRGLVEAEWRPSENNRRARYYTLTPAGRKRLREETANWRRYSRAVEAVLQGA